jgi:hypothetical protein
MLAVTCETSARNELTEDEALRVLLGGPDPVRRYLGAYTHRVAISNHRLVTFVDDQVTLRWRDSAHNNKKTADDASGR